MADEAQQKVETGKPAIKAGTRSPSIDEIAKSMIAPSADDPASSSGRLPDDDADPAPRPQKGVPASDEDDASGEIDDTQEEETSNKPVTTDEDDADDQADLGDQDEDDDPLSFLDDGAGDKSRDDDDTEGEALDTSKLRDDLKLSVTVDGEEEEVTLGDLKRRYAGNGAIEKRLQEATEARQAAFKDYEQGRQITEAVFKQFGQALFRRTVPQPPPELLDKNPQAYMRQKELYDQETTALTQSNMQLHKMMKDVDAANQRQKEEERKWASQKLREIMPVFNDPVKGPKVRAAILEAAKEIGYTDDEIAQATHPLMFKTMALAARELRRQKMAKLERVKPKERTLKNKGSAKKPKTQQQRQQDAAAKRARETGKVDDVAMTLLQPSPKKRGRRR